MVPSEIAQSSPGLKGAEAEEHLVNCDTSTGRAEVTLYHSQKYESIVLDTARVFIMTGRIRRTLAELEGRDGSGQAKLSYESYEDMFPSQRRARTAEDSKNNATIINELREKREWLFRKRMLRQYLKLADTLPLPDPHFGSHLHQPGHDLFNPCRLNVEHLQDLRNKCTIIYLRGERTFDVGPMYEFILEHWLHLDPDAGGDIHRLDIEFARFFAKFVTFVDQKVTTQQILSIHAALIEASLASYRSAYRKKSDKGHSEDHWFIAGWQVEFFKIKPLLQALIIIIDKKILRSNPETGEEKDFTKQEVRLVLTGPTRGLSQPISFDNDLSIIERLNDYGVITTFSEAIHFVIELDQREEAFLEKRSEKVLDYWLGLPLEQLKWNYSKFSRKSKGEWTGEETDVPVGPSTLWWNDGLVRK